MTLSKKPITAKKATKKLATKKAPVKKQVAKKTPIPVAPPTRMLAEGENPNPSPNFFSKILSTVKNFIVSTLKSIKPIYIILGIVVLCIIFYFWFSSPSKYKQENKDLKNEIAQIQKERNKIKDSLITLKSDYIKLEDSIEVKNQILDEINIRMVLIEQKVNQSFSQLNDVRGAMNNINVQLKQATEKPVKRVGDDLIKSLKNKIK